MRNIFGTIKMFFKNILRATLGVSLFLLKELLLFIFFALSFFVSVLCFLIVIALPLIALKRKSNKFFIFSVHFQKSLKRNNYKNMNQCKKSNYQQKLLLSQNWSSDNYMPNKTVMHFSASTFMSPYLYKFSTVVQIMHFLCFYRQICIKFSTNLE